jgi:hypothetical protein
MIMIFGMKYMELDTLKRSPRISNEIKELKLKMSDFISINTKLIAEVKSLKTIPCSHSGEWRGWDGVGGGGCTQYVF